MNSWIRGKPISQETAVCVLGKVKEIIQDAHNGNCYIRQETPDTINFILEQVDAVIDLINRQV